MKQTSFSLAGMHKLTTLDYPGVVSAIVFTQGCNFHCPYCHNPHLIPDRAPGLALAPETALSFLEKRAGLLDGVVISGGEPTLQPGLGDFCRRARDLGYRIKLDTNGSRPCKLESLLAAGLLDYVALDLKTLPEQYVPALSPEPDTAAQIRRSVALLKASGIAHEFRTTCVRPFFRPDMVCALGALAGPESAWFLQRPNLSDAMRARGLEAWTTQGLDAALQQALDLKCRAAVR